MEIQASFPIRLIAYARDYKKCPKLDEPRFRINADSQFSLSKSESIRDFKSELIAQLFLRSGVPHVRDFLIRFFTALLLPTPTPLFLSLPQGVELRLPLTPLDNRTPGRPTTKLPCPQWSITTVGWFLSFITTGAMQV
ncbi:hypothetical protein AVEN_193091-1 [Araneus ventricosus]|uniref:Uncharacterized protein n=1 Tax=Araneus ventricosus TaxID=182803 RepID=A0A4Y2AZW2_ARAVE|nr:hypothetical protein AVEN_193091-1 [Araneus ventricosus]